MLQTFETEWEWLKAREANLNTTDLAALFGFDEYRSRLSLWCEKKGLHEPEYVETPFSEWGKWLQVPVGMKICADNGWSAYDLTGSYISFPDLRLGASMDILARDPEKGGGLLEIKVAERLTEDMGWTKEAAPLRYEFQIQGQMHLALKDGQEIKWGAIGVLGSRQKSRVYHRVYDVNLGKKIDIEAEKFWESIEANKPPPADYTVDRELLESLRGSLRPDDQIILTGNQRAEILVRKIELIKRTKKPFKERLKLLEKLQKARETELHQMIGRHEIAKIGNKIVKAKIQHIEDKVTYGSSFRRCDISTVK